VKRNKNLNHVVPNFRNGSDYGYACLDERVSLSFKRCGSRGIVVRPYGYDVDSFRCDFHLADF